MKLLLISVEYRAFSYSVHPDTNSICSLVSEFTQEQLARPGPPDKSSIDASGADVDTDPLAEFYARAKAEAENAVSLSSPTQFFVHPCP
jgi:hypothetical protein